MWRLIANPGGGWLRVPEYGIRYLGRLRVPLTVLLLASGCGSVKAQSDRVPERVPNPGANVPIVGRAIDSTHRVVCYVFPNGSGDCEKF